jgi:predicted secreted protein
MKLFRSCLLGLCSLVGFLGAKEVTVTEIDNGKTVHLEAGDTLCVALEGNPTTGFEWKQTCANEEQLHAESTTYTPHSVHCCGSSGTFSFKYTVASEASSRLCFTYARPWEEGASPAKTFEITVASKGTNSN